MSDTRSVVELRCEDNPSRLFAKLRLTGEKPAYVQPDNLIEIACHECARRDRKDDPTIKRVFHLYNIMGEFIRSEIER